MLCICASETRVSTNAFVELSNSIMEAASILLGFSPIFTWAVAIVEEKMSNANNILFKFIG
jgi:hypothetical protein